MTGTSQSAAALRRRRYEAKRAADVAARWETTARGYECPDCRVTGPHPVHRIGEVLEVECGSDWCGREFFIDWRARL